MQQGPDGIKRAPHRRFSDDDIRAMRKQLACGMSVRQLARQHVCAEKTVRDIKLGRSYKWVR